MGSNAKEDVQQGAELLEEQTQQDGKDKGARTFTQEEVDEIVRRRVARAKKNAGGGTAADESEDSRVKALEARELKVKAKELLQEQGFSSELADVLRYDSEETLANAIEKMKEDRTRRPGKAWGQRMNSNRATHDPIRAAMGLDR